MNIFSSNSRDALFVPSMRCQSLLGKAVFEHFTESEHVASVFSSSPSLQNSSAGANFLMSFNICRRAISLFETVFTAQDCSSLQFASSIEIKFCSIDNDVCRWYWRRIFAFLSNLISEQQINLEACLRSLTFSSEFIDDDQLHFVLPKLKRLTKLVLYGKKITSAGIMKSVGENLLELKALTISWSNAVNNSVLQFFAEKLTKLEVLVLNGCRQAFDEKSTLGVSQMRNLTSLSISYQEVEHAHGFFNENLERISSNLHLRQLSLIRCPISFIGMRSLRSLKDLYFLDLNGSTIAQGIIEDICSLRNLIKVDLSRTLLTDDCVLKISVSLFELRKLNLSYCGLLTDESLHHLKNLVLLDELDIDASDNFSPRPMYELLKSLTRLTRFSGTCEALAIFSLLKDPKPQKVGWAGIADEGISLLVEILGDEGCDQIRRVSLEFGLRSVSELSVALVSQKMKNLTVLCLDRSESIHLQYLNFEDDDDNNNNKNNNNITSSSRRSSRRCLHAIPSLTELGLYKSSTNDIGVELFVSAFKNLKILVMNYCHFITENALIHLRKLEFLEQLSVDGVRFSTQALHSFVMDRRATLKKVSHSAKFRPGAYAKHASDILRSPFKTVLDWSVKRDHLKDEDVPLLFELIGDQHCLRIEEINFSNNSNHLTESILDLVAVKCCNVKKIDLRGCKNISSLHVERFKREVPSCEIVVVCENEKLEKEKK
jgi:hypothetical protein